jgi:hypothetical protein
MIASTTRPTEAEALLAELSAKYSYDTVQIFESSDEVDETAEIVGIVERGDTWYEFGYRLIELIDSNHAVSIAAVKL